MRAVTLALYLAAFSLIAQGVAKYLLSPAFDASPSASEVPAAVAASSPALTTDRAGMGDGE